MKIAVILFLTTAFLGVGSVDRIRLRNRYFYWRFFNKALITLEGTDALPIGFTPQGAGQLDIPSLYVGIKFEEEASGYDIEPKFVDTNTEENLDVDIILCAEDQVAFFWHSYNVSKFDPNVYFVPVGVKGTKNLFVVKSLNQIAVKMLPQEETVDDWHILSLNMSMMKP